MRRWGIVAVPALVAALAAGLVTGCSVGLKAPPSNASKTDFCTAYAGIATLVDHTKGAPITRWDTVRTAMQDIHRIGTPAGSDKKARETVLRLSDIVVNADGESDGRVQVDGLIKDKPTAIAQMQAFYGPFCAAQK